MTVSNTPIKVSKRTKELIALGASISGISMEELVDNAVNDYLKANREKIEQGIEDCKRVLGLMDGKL